MSGWLCFVIGAVAGGCLGYGCAAVFNISGQQSRDEERRMTNDNRKCQK